MSHTYLEVVAHLEVGVAHLSSHDPRLLEAPLLVQVLAEVPLTLSSPPPLLSSSHAWFFYASTIYGCDEDHLFLRSLVVLQCFPPPPCLFHSLSAPLVHCYCSLLHLVMVLEGRYKWGPVLHAAGSMLILQ